MFNPLEDISKGGRGAGLGPYLFQAWCTGNDNIGLARCKKVQHSTLEDALDVLNGDVSDLVQHGLHVVRGKASDDLSDEACLSSAGQRTLLISESDNDTANSSLEQEWIKEDSPTDVVLYNFLAGLERFVRLW